MFFKHIRISDQAQVCLHKYMDCGSRYTCNMLNRRSKLLSNSKALHFSDLMEFEEFYLRFLINKTKV